MNILEVDFEHKSWWNYIHEDLRELIKESVLLLDKVPRWKEKFHDYAFIVFPAAKAYEGFLKNLFYDLGFITQDDYFGKRFRIGKALNPSLEKKYQDEGVYNKIIDYCGDPALAERLWDAWKSCRNILFHWFPDEKNAIDYQEAKDRIELVISTIDTAYEVCKVKKTNPV